ncbi:MAG: 1-acyl-sn-glycerol-3-phosphate acyltransferase [Deltaproteobacteria bacterium]|jgi:1-acyl-sn-glycerol-3-phosphate acyltransferase|nr:1-acyl-sn-glycerol-3-phosphate acyltransferase [Deltaproteobacteria bacterium]MBW2534598.1 1-acyl-sn-glycerol-3-phosphate acyltransferase [Deltaproteobacteria bacterium]
MHPEWWANRAEPGEPGRVDPKVIRWFRRNVEPVVRLLHRPRLYGVERLPVDRPYLLVVNHSAGMAAGEVLSLVACYLEQVGTERPLAGMAHPFGFSIWPISFFFRGIGAIPSTYGAAEQALSSGVPVVVFPGGDWESTRPVWQANRVTFGGHRGFLRLARRAGVPVVPLGIRGSHYSAPMLFRSRLLAWLTVVPVLLGLERFPMTLLGLAGAVAISLGVGSTWGWPLAALLTWVWLASPFPMLPWIPSTIRMQIGEVIEHEDLFAGSDDEALDQAYQRVEGEVQALVRALGAR